MGDVQPLEILDPRVLELVAADAKVRHHGGDGVWTEGPVYLPTSDSVIWSDIPNNRIMRWHDGHITTWRQPSNFTNGHTLDHEGRIIHCSHGARAMLRTEHDGTVTTLIDRFEGRRFNSPNDVVVARDGSIWFTDPPYGILSNKEGYKADSEQPGCYVYRLVPTTGEVTVMVTDLIRPNGLAFSPDESLLYVSDTSQGDFGDSGLPHIYVYDVDHGVGGAVGVSATNGRGFCRVREGLSDGFRLDTAGNIYTSSGTGIEIFSPDATRLGHIPVPEKVSNCCWGGRTHHTLYITATSGLYSIDLLATHRH
jgi:gluconolactonase